MEVVAISEEEFNIFANKFKYKSYLQTSYYGKVMSLNDYQISYIGIKNDNNSLVGASLLVYRSMFMGKKIAYAPRGILYDFTDKEKTIEVFNLLKQYLNKQGFLILRIDPYIPATIRNINGKIVNINNEVNQVMINLKASGFKYKGKNLYFEHEQPRYEAIVLLNKDTSLLYNELDKRVKHKIKRALGCAITIYKDNTKNTSLLYEICKDRTALTSKYIQDFARTFPGSDVYYALLNTDSFVMEAKRRYEKELEKNEVLAKKVQESMKENNQHLLNAKMSSDNLINTYKNDLVFATNLLKQYPRGLVISAALTIEYDNAKYLIIDGYKSQFSHLNASYLMKWYIIEDSKKHNLKYFNMNAISGNFTPNNQFKNLNDSKLDYNAIPTEYIGEFDLVLNGLDYVIYKGLSKDKNYKLSTDTKKEKS